MTVREILRSALLILEQAGCGAPRLDAELLLATVLKKDRTWLIAHANDDIPSSIQARFTALLKRRRAREPVAYILGEKEFWSRPFFVTPDVLIPRPETEHLIEAVLAHCPDTKKEFHFCDIGTGSGCLAVTLACEYPEATVVATDISHASLEIARKNAERHGVSSHIKFRRGDMFAPLQKQDGYFDAIVSNPPYVAQDELDTLEAELGFEPRHALTDESSGLIYLQSLVDQAPPWLTGNGVLVVETGLCGLPAATEPLHLHQEIHDLAGHLRGGVYTFSHLSGTGSGQHKQK